MKLDILMHYEVNEQTGEVTFIGKEEINIDTAKKPSSPKTLGGDEPKLVLESNKYALNEAACKLLKVEAGTTLYINYPKKDGKYVPVIGASEAFGVKSGNKLTKGLTVSYRGAANEKLAEYGTNFEFIESEHPGIYYLKGDKVVSTKQENAIEIDDTFELDDLEDIALDLDESTDISTIDLTL
jgi:hypothetical protein